MTSRRRDARFAGMWHAILAVLSVLGMLFADEIPFLQA